MSGWLCCNSWPKKEAPTSLAHLFVHVADPLCKLQGVGDGRGKKDIVHVVRQQNDGLLPDDTALYNDGGRCRQSCTKSGIVASSDFRFRNAIRGRTQVTHVVDFVKDDPANLSHNLWLEAW